MVKLGEASRRKDQAQEEINALKEKLGGIEAKMVEYDQIIKELRERLNALSKHPTPQDWMEQDLPPPPAPAVC